MKKTVSLLHDVVFGEAGYFFSVLLFGIFKGIPYNFFTSRTADEFQALYDFICLLMLDPGIQIFLIFPDNHQIHDRMLGCHKGM